MTAVAVMAVGWAAEALLVMPRQIYLAVGRLQLAMGRPLPPLLLPLLLATRWRRLLRLLILSLHQLLLRVLLKRCRSRCPQQDRRPWQRQRPVQWRQSLSLLLLPAALLLLHSRVWVVAQLLRLLLLEKVGAMMLLQLQQLPLPRTRRRTLLRAVTHRHRLRQQGGEVAVPAPALSTN